VAKVIHPRAVTRVALEAKARREEATKVAKEASPWHSAKAFPLAQLQVQCHRACWEEKALVALVAAADLAAKDQELASAPQVSSHLAAQVVQWVAKWVVGLQEPRLAA